MRFIILLLLFFSSCFGVFAQSWSFVGHDSNGRSIYVDSSSIKVDDFQHKIDESKPIIISAVIKSDKVGTDHYIEGQIRFYSTGWIEADTQYIYHKGTGKIINSFTLPKDKNPTKVEKGTVDEQIFNNLFGQYYERNKASNIENLKASKGRNSKQINESPKKESTSVVSKSSNTVERAGKINTGSERFSVTFVYIGWIMLLELIFRTILKRLKAVTVYNRLFFYIITFAFIMIFGTVSPPYRGSVAHYISECLGYIIGHSIIPLMLSIIVGWGLNKIKNKNVENE